MPKSNARSEPSDGNTEQWEKVKEMRDRQAAVTRGESTGTPVQVIGIEPPAEETPPAGDQPRNPDGTFAAKMEPPPAEPETPPVVAAPKEEKPPPAPPIVREVTIDGMKVNLAPELADAFERAEKIKTDTAKVTEREQLKDELRQELKAEFTPPAKSEAEIAAEAALRAAEEAKNAPKEPDSKLLIENPDEWQKQSKAFNDYRLEKAKREAKDEALREVRTRDAALAKSTEEQARSILREQFYAAYPPLKDSADIVDLMLSKGFDNIVASGRLNKPMTPAERDAAKSTFFAGIAAQATRRLVKLMSGGKKVAPPAEPPPVLASSAPKKASKPPEEKVVEAKTKYPKGSISAVLAERRAKQMGVSV